MADGHGSRLGGGERHTERLPHRLPERGRYASERLESDSGNAICSFLTFAYPSDPNFLVEGGSIGGKCKCGEINLESSSTCKPVR
jgi:hypothetical protein